jgi:ubiquinone/menaquinone biosynthesis C-methylase UbiE
LTAPEPSATTIGFVEHYLNRYAGPGDRILDIGCGPATYRHTTGAEYVGLDVTDEPYSPELARDVDVVASASEMPFAAAEFDLVFTLSTLYQVPDWELALREIRRVLRPGGRVLLFDYNRRAQARLERLYERKLPKWTAGRLRREVRRAGFADSRLLPATETSLGGLALRRRLLAEELRGQWAIVTGLA